MGLTLTLSCPRTTSVREDHKVTFALPQVHNLRLSNLSALQGLCKYSSHSRNRQRLFQFLPKMLKTKKILLTLKIKKKREKHALKPQKGRLSSRLSGSDTKPVSTSSALNQKAKPWRCGCRSSLMRCLLMT